MKRLLLLALIGAAALIPAAAISLLTVSDAGAAFPGQNGKIAYVAGSRIATVQPNGTGVTYLTSTSTRAANPNWSADGTKIVYQSANNSGRSPQIWRMLANGSAKVNLSNSKTSDTQPAFFPDGKVAFVRNGQIWRMNADGTAKTRLTAPPPGYSDDRPSVSPDGTKVAFERLGYPFPGMGWNSTQILVVNANGSGLVNLSNSVGKTSDFGPDWSPTGQRIIFTRYVDPVPDQIYVMDATGANQARLSTANAAPTPAYAPDGTRIVFEGFPGGAPNTIETVATTGGSPTVVIRGMQPSWQPLP